MEDKRVPELRFKGFTDDWELCVLNDVVNVNSGRDYKHLSSGDIPVYGTGGYMLSVNEALSYTEDAIGIGRKGTIDKPFILKSPFWTVDTLFYSIPREGNNLDYLFALFQKINWKSKDESTGVPSLSKATINNIKIYSTCVSEQTKIGDFLSTLDRTITLHQCKLEELQLLKKAYLQQMFPKKDEVVPKLRFANFNEIWDQRTLGEFGRATGGTSIESEFNDNGKYKVISIGSYSEDSKYTDQGIRVNKSKKIEQRILNKNDLTMILNDKTSSGKIIGRVLLIDSDNTYVYNQRTERIEVNQNMYDSHFLYQLLNADAIRNKIVSVSQGNTQIYVNWSTISKIFYAIPVSRKEQSRIGSFFCKLDQVITLHQQKLDNILKLKDAYLQKMFI